MQPFSSSLARNRLGHLFHFEFLLHVGAHRFLLTLVVIVVLPVFIDFMLGDVRWCFLEVRLSLFLWIYSHRYRCFVNLVWNSRINDPLSLRLFLIVFTSFAHDSAYMAKNVVFVRIRRCFFHNHLRLRLWRISSSCSFHPPWLSQHSSMHRTWHVGFVVLVLQIRRSNKLECTYRLVIIVVLWTSWVALWAYRSQLQFWVTFFENDCVHSVNRAICVTVWKELFAFHRTRNNIAHQWVLFGQISSKIHFLPLELFSDA